MKPNLFAAACLCLLTLFVAACNTVEGMGEDISAAGHAINGGAQSVKKRM